MTQRVYITIPGVNSKQKEMNTDDLNDLFNYFLNQENKIEKNNRCFFEFYLKNLTLFLNQQAINVIISKMTSLTDKHSCIKNDFQRIIRAVSCIIVLLCYGKEGANPARAVLVERDCAFFFTKKKRVCESARTSLAYVLVSLTSDNLIGSKHCELCEAFKGFV